MKKLLRYAEGIDLDLPENFGNLEKLRKYPLTLELFSEISGDCQKTSEGLQTSSDIFGRLRTTLGNLPKVSHDLRQSKYVGCPLAVFESLRLTLENVRCNLHW